MTVTGAGQQVTYTFVVTNTGNVTVATVAVADPMLSSVSCPQPKLAPGQDETCKGSPYTTTSADVTAGKLTNTATASAKGGTTGTKVTSDPSSVTVTLSAAATTTPTTPTTTTTTPGAAASGTSGTSGGVQPLHTITAGHGLWGPDGPTGALWGMFGGLLVLVTGATTATVVWQRRRRRA